MPLDMNVETATERWSKHTEGVIATTEKGS